MTDDIEKSPFQFSLCELLLIVAAIAVWITAAKFSETTHAPPLFARILIFAGIAAAIYLLSWRNRIGWAIAIIGAPLVAIFALALAFVLSG